MAKYIVEFQGRTEVDAESSLEAEAIAAAFCTSDYCQAVITNFATQLSAGGNDHE